MKYNQIWRISAKNRDFAFLNVILVTGAGTGVAKSMHNECTPNAHHLGYVSITAQRQQFIYVNPTDQEYADFGVHVQRTCKIAPMYPWCRSVLVQ